MASTEDVTPIIPPMAISRLPETPVSCSQVGNHPVGNSEKNSESIYQFQPISPIMMSAMQVSHQLQTSSITAIPDVPIVTPPNVISPNGTKRKRMPGMK